MRETFYRSSCGLLCLSVLLLSCQGPENEGPYLPQVENSIGPSATTPLPPQAELIESDEFIQLYQEGRLILSKDMRLQQLGIDTQPARSMDEPKEEFVHPVQPLSLEERAQIEKDAKTEFENEENQSRVRGLNRSSSSTANKMKPLTTPTLDPISCDDDEGKGMETDLAKYASCESFSPKGIYANFDWPLKAHITCTKNQANRGTCGAFAIVAAVETEISFQLDQRVNLSEQDFYSRIKNDWGRSLVGDGVDQFKAYRNAEAKSYVFSFENAWDYNPSRTRGYNKAQDGYVRSCIGYNGAACSDTVHQAKFYCADYLEHRYCGFASPIDYTSTSGFEISGTTELWNYEKLDQSLANIQLALNANHPVTLGMAVPPSWDLPNADGYITYVDDTHKSRGGHLVQIFGAITNETLALALPSAPPGAGGGYFIIKNSWGPCYADAGIVYAPFEWVKKNSWSAMYIDEVRTH